MSQPSPELSMIDHHHANTVEYISHKLKNGLHLNDSEVYLPANSDLLITVMLKISVIKIAETRPVLESLSQSLHMVVKREIEIVKLKIVPTIWFCLDPSDPVK